MTPPDMRLTLSALGKRLLALLFGFVIALGLAEALVRGFDLAPTRGVVTVTEHQFGVLPGLFAPGQVLLDHRHPALVHRVRIDSLGYRGPDFPRRKPAGEFRILLAGDSYTYGDFVDDDATLPTQLAERLRLRCRGVHVLNAGVGGTTIIEHTHMIERALPLSPDLVVLVFSENDVADLAVRPMWEQLADNRRAKSRLPLSLIYPVLSRTALWNLLLKARGALRGRGAATDPARFMMPTVDSAVASLRERYAERLRSLRDFLRTRGIPLVFVVYPAHHAVAAPDRRWQVEWAVRIGREAGLPTLELLGALTATGLETTSLYLLPHDGHPSPRGYAAAADTLAAFLGRSGLLRAPCGG